MPFGTTPNLFARIGDRSPHFCFAGHTDVVPPGPDWRHQPFEAEVQDGVLYGRGACDMKGAIACFVAACGDYLHSRHEHGGAATLPGSLSLLITGDEEGAAVNGTVRVLGWMAEHGHLPDMCLVGEPTSPTTLGEVVKIGRRGSLNATIVVSGTQGHVAYPLQADNPVHRLNAALHELIATRIDGGTEWFQPSSLQVTSIDVDNPTSNVIPGKATARLNIRFNDLHTGSSLQEWLQLIVGRHCDRAAIDVSVSGEAFLTQPGDFTRRLSDAIERATGVTPRLDTGGGTSDARFVARHVPVAEFGLVGATMHKADECVPVLDLERLNAIYGEIIREFLP